MIWQTEQMKVLNNILLTKVNNFSVMLNLKFDSYNFTSSRVDPGEIFFRLVAP